MRLTLAAIGRMKAGPERELVDRYLARLGAAGPSLGLEFAGVSEFSESRARGSDERKREEAGRLGAAIGEGAVLLVLDERGKTLRSEEFAAAVGAWRDGGRRTLGLALGGPDGHDAAFRGRADLVLSLGRMTFPHQIARILVAEQLYRAVTILGGHPYHRV